MTPLRQLRAAPADLLSAVQFLTRIPVPARPYDPTSLARAVKFFPLVGALVGAGAAGLHLALAPHLPRLAAALLVVLYLVVITGGLHEDGLADAADGFGGGHTREKILLILRDSRIGSYGGLALVFSVVGRVVLVAAIPLPLVTTYLVLAGLLSRWTAVPLSHFLRPARDGDDGQGARIAQRSPLRLLLTIALYFTTATAMVGPRAITPIASAVLIALFSGIYYQRRIGGVTGDCFGATIQLSEIAVLLCGVWIR